MGMGLSFSICQCGNVTGLVQLSRLSAGSRSNKDRSRSIKVKLQLKCMGVIECFVYIA